MSVWLIGGIAFLALFFLWLTVTHFRPSWRAWRKEQRLVRACDKAFGADNYRLQRLKLPVSRPPLLARLLRLADAPKKFHTYEIIPAGDEEPDYSGLSRREIGLVRHYLGPRHVTHEGKQTIREPASSSVENGA